MEKKISISQIRSAVQEAYEAVKDNTDGKNADYIPYLANIYPDLSLDLYTRQCSLGVMGIAAFAPPLDEAGNSVKAQLAVKHVVQKLGLGVFRGDNVTVV